MAIIPVRKRPGLYYNTDTGKFFSLVNYRDGDVYDTAQVSTTTPAAGNEMTFFQDLTNKRMLDTNLKTPRRIGKGSEMLIKRIGIDVPLYFNNTQANRTSVVAPDDIKKLIYGTRFIFKINGKTIAEGPSYAYPSGYGLAGQTTENNTGIVSVGVPSTAAQRQLEKVHEVTSEHDLEASLFWDDRPWLATNTFPTLEARILARCFVGGLIREAATT